MKSYFKNPIYYVGILLIFFEVFQILQPYLKLHYWENDAQVEAAKLKHINDADVMNGYLPSTEKERIEIAPAGNLPKYERGIRSQQRGNG